MAKYNKMVGYQNHRLNKNRTKCQVTTLERDNFMATTTIAFNS